MLLSALIFTAVVGLIAWRPKGMPVVLPALGGAVLVLLAGLVPVADLGRIVGMTWEATLTLVGLLLLARVLDAAGLFAWTAAVLARRCAPSTRRAWLAYAVLAVVLTLLLANDGAIVILTPILAEMALLLRWSPPQAAPFLWTAGFLIDAASTPLVMANLTNILAADALDLSLAAYWRLNAPGFAAAVVASLLMLLVVFGRRLQGTFDITVLPPPATLIKDRTLFAIGWVVLSALAAMYLLHRLWPLPVVVLVAGAALVMLAAAAWRRPDQVWPLVQTAPWDVVVFAAAMFVVVWGLGNAGWREALANCWLPFATRPVALVIVIGVSISLLSALANNLPALLLALLVIPSLPAAVQLPAVAAALIGSNIGCKLTPYGSLATLLWLDQLEQHGYRISWAEVLRIGAILTPPVVAAALAAQLLAS